MPVIEPVFTSPYSRSQGSGRAVEIELSERERDLIVNHTLADEVLIRDLHLAPAKPDSGKYRFSWEELDDLAGYVAAESNHARNKKLSQEWSRIYDKLTAALDSRRR